MNDEHDTFTSQELAECLSHYDIGQVISIREFPRGSRRSPKVIIESSRGKFLFKRRASGRDDRDKVAFAHQLQIKLADQDFPLARLVSTQRHRSSLLVREGCIYEMFEYVPGQMYDMSLGATASAAEALALFHKVLRGFQCKYEPPVGSYHDSPTVQRAVRRTVGALPIDARPPGAKLNRTVTILQKAYRHSAEEANKLGVGGWEIQIGHGDWHPGNMLFAGGRVAAVIDYDAVRRQQRIMDIANGALQFSIVAGSKDPARWPDDLDRARFGRFVGSYMRQAGISKDEIEAIPYLMCEAMIAEAVLPIAATGSFGRVQGFAFLEMVTRKVNWILANGDELYDAVES